MNARQVDQARRALAAARINAWHVADHHAPQALRDFAGVLSPKRNTEITSVAWFLQGVPVSFEIERYRVDGKLAFLAAHPVVPTDSIRRIGNAGRSVARRDITEDAVLREFAVAIKRLHGEHETEGLHRWKSMLHEEQQGECAVCYCLVELADARVKRIVPTSWGGDAAPANLRVVCPVCLHSGQPIKGLFCAWMHEAGIWDYGWSPADLEVLAANPLQVWQSIKPEAIPAALFDGPERSDKGQRNMNRRIERWHEEIAELRGRWRGCPFVPAALRDDPWNRWPDMIRADPMKYAGKDDYEFLDALGAPITGSNCTPKIRARLRRRLHSVLKSLDWSAGRYALGKAPVYADGARRFVPPGCDLLETMGADFDLENTPFGQEQPSHAPKAEAIHAKPVQAVLPAPASDSVLEDLRFVITGKFGGITRDQIANLIERGGGRVVSAVSRKTSYLLLGEDAGSKLAKARDLGIQSLDLAGLRRLLKGES